MLPDNAPTARAPALLTLDQLQHLWDVDWQALRARGDGHALRDALLACHEEPQRHYHTLRHLAECLTWLGELRACASRPEVLAMALWFHDAVYDPQRADNEQRSADWARDALLAHAVAPATARRVHDLVLATRHDAPATDAPGGPDPDRDLLLDIDLSILGADPARFAEYGREIRAEYAFVPRWIYRRKRRAVLAGFAARVPLYATAPLGARLEAQAHRNLAQAPGGTV
jgi:predicted metal-dependent HD superfamily phosphohydrolase